MIDSRRRFLFGAGITLLAAPAIVRVAANLMPAKPLHIRTTAEAWNSLLRSAERIAVARIEATRQLTEALYSHGGASTFWEAIDRTKQVHFPFAEIHGSLWIPKANWIPKENA